MKVEVLVPAAGLGKRLKTPIPKPLILLNGKPLIVYALEVFSKCSLIDSITIAAGKEDARAFKKVVRRYKITKVKKIIEGGKTRRQSVHHGLQTLDNDTAIVLIHDADRPFIDMAIIKDSIRAAQKYGACVVAVPVKSTIKEADLKNNFVKRTLNRKVLWEVQTPQVFKKEIILKAHRTVRMKDPGDDALLVEKMGQKVKFVMGSYKNIKITTPEDLILAKAILSNRRFL